MKNALLIVGVILILLSLAFVIFWRGAISGITDSIIAIIGIILIVWSVFASGEGHKMGGQKM